MKKIRVFQKLVDVKRPEANDPNLFVFCDKSTGVTHYRAESGADGDTSVERIAGVLAMQCLVRGHNPEDLLVLVPAERSLAGRFLSRAKELLEEGRAVATPACLSPRQSEILDSVIRNRANKEIANKLNITVRTVKFHISSLLDKFGVDNRADLARKAAGLFRSTEENEPAAVLPPTSIGTEPHRAAPIKSSPREATKARNMRFNGSMLSA